MEKTQNMKIYGKYKKYKKYENIQKIWKNTRNMKIYGKYENIRKIQKIHKNTGIFLIRTLRWFKYILFLHNLHST